MRSQMPLASSSTSGLPVTREQSEKCTGWRHLRLQLPTEVILVIVEARCWRGGRPPASVRAASSIYP